MYTADGKIWIATGETPIYLEPKMANRHGLIAGATGTGKTVSLKVMAESFSDLGVPVFMVDIKGDVSGMAQPGSPNEKVTSQLEKCRVSEDFDFKGYPVMFWDLYGEKGIPVRTTISEMGSTLLARLLDLNDTQAGVLDITFRVADEKQLLLEDIKDLKAMLQYVGDNAKELQFEYGNVSRQTVGAIVRSLLSLEDAGGNIFFAEPSLDIRDWVRTTSDSRGIINILDCVKLGTNPKLYSTFLLWLLSDLYETFPEVGDMEKPRMVFFFDEAHLLFKDAPKALMDKLEQVIRLIRSKGIGIYFITQSPSDIPETILAQLGNRIQHALRAFTPAEQRAVKTAADTFRANPAFSTADAITVLGTGEALVSFLDNEGAPSVVQRAFILPPKSYMGPCDEEKRRNTYISSDLYVKYERTIDNFSAYESLKDIADEAQQEKEEEERLKAEEKQRIIDERNAEKLRKEEERLAEKQKREEERLADKQKKEEERLADKQKREEERLADKKKREEERKAEAARKEEERKKNKAKNTMEKIAESTVRSTVGQIGRDIGRSIVRGLFGNLKK